MFHPLNQVRKRTDIETAHITATEPVQMKEKV